MKHAATYLSGAVLPTVVAVTLVMLTAMLGLIALWQQHTLLYARSQRLRQARADVASAVTLCLRHPERETLTAADGYLLYDSLPQSRIVARRERWGLYGLLHVAAADSIVSTCRLVGVEPDARHTLFYADNRTAVTLAGDTRLHGVLHLPQNGLAYGRMGMTFFCGRQIPHTAIRRASAALPAPSAEAAALIDSLFALSTAVHLSESLPDSLGADFRDQTMLLRLGAAEIGGCMLHGRIMLAADELRIDSTCRMEHTIVAARKITLGRGAHITAQLFALDTVVVEPRAALEYPSGIYAGRYAELCDRATVDGCVIVRDTNESTTTTASYRQCRTARVRGLLYVDGVAQVQGIVAGCAVLRQAACFSPQGYYPDMLCDLTLLENLATAQPLWLAGRDSMPRKEVLCVE